jgi:hypothetical protein
MSMKQHLKKKKKSIHPNTEAAGESIAATTNRISLKKYYSAQLTIIKLHTLYI